LKLTTGLAAATAVMALAILGFLAGCGGGDESSPTVLKLSIGEEGKKAAFEAPKSATGGLVTVELKNEGKAPHGLQLIEVRGNHTAEEALEEVASESEETPEWIRAKGGIGTVPPGQTGSATLELEEGEYALVDAAALFGGAGPPATAEMSVTPGDSGDLPDTPATVTAAETGKDEFAWENSGLEAGENEITFKSEGDDSIHVIIAAPVKGEAPPLSQIKKDLGAEEGPPPRYIDFENAQSTAVLDGGLSQTTTLDLEKPGQYIFFCPLTDRDGGKSHDQEGLLSVETVK
jgi:hypothetical protein